MKNIEAFHDYSQSKELSQDSETIERQAFLTKNANMADNLIGAGEITKDRLDYISDNKLGLNKSIETFENWSYHLHMGTLQLAERIYQKPEANSEEMVDKLQSTIEVSSRLTLSDINSLKPELVHNSLSMTINTVEQLLTQVKNGFDVDNIAEYVDSKARREALANQFK